MQAALWKSLENQKLLTFVDPILSIGIAGFWDTIPSLSRYRPAPDFFGIPAEGYLEMSIQIKPQVSKRSRLPEVFYKKKHSKYE